MYTAIQITAYLTLYSEPLLPHTAAKLKKSLRLENWEWNSANQQFTPLVESGKIIQSPGLLFEKVEDNAVEKQLAKLEQSKEQMEETPSKTPRKEEIDFESFSKMELRVGLIKSAVRVPKTDKLLQFEIDLGFETRTILSGIAEHYNPEDVIGKKVTVLVNLAPRKIRGVVSQGMLLLAENTDGSLTFISPENPDITAGSEIS
jgi:methionyl-tRNA synthetase